MTDWMKQRESIIRELERRSLVSLMNDTKREQLQKEISTLPFPPPFQMKLVLNKEPFPLKFYGVPNYYGDWSDESLEPFLAIEWLRIRPRYSKPQGQLLAPMVHVIKEQFIMTLEKLKITFKLDEEDVVTFGHCSSKEMIVK